MPQAYSTEEFVESIGVNVHWTFPKYTSNIEALKTLLVDSGIRHQRDLMNGSDLTQRQIIGDLSELGVKSNMLIFPAAGVVPNEDFWSGNATRRTVLEYLNYMPEGCIDSIEGINEIDAFYYLYKWHPVIDDDLSTDPDDDLYYGKYALAIAQATWDAVRSDSRYDDIKIIGPSIGFQVPTPFGDNSLEGYVDYGCFHPYPARVNASNTPLSYGGITNYYWNSFQPSSNISIDTPYNITPLMFDWYQPPFNSKQMWATESGYSNGLGAFGYPISASTKMTPRLFAEYFRNNIKRTFYYELVDELDDGSNEGSDGLVYYDLTPKPAYIALQSLIRLVEEPGIIFNPGSLNYSLDVEPNGGYTRTSYVHDLLLQKSNGEFYLMLWHEISNSSDTLEDGTPITEQQRYINQPSLTTTITLPSYINSAWLYTYNDDNTFDSQFLTITNNQVVIEAQDRISVLKLTSGETMADYIVLEDGGKIILEDGSGFILSEESSASVSLSVSDVNESRRSCSRTIKISITGGYYSPGGINMDLSQTLNPLFLPGGKFTSIPTSATIRGNFGVYDVKIIPSTSLLDWKLQIFVTGLTSNSVFDESEGGPVNGGAVLPNVIYVDFVSVKI